MRDAMRWFGHWFVGCGRDPEPTQRHKVKPIHSDIVIGAFHFDGRALFDEGGLVSSDPFAVAPGINGWRANRYPNAPEFRKIVSALHQVPLIQFGHSAMI